MSDTATATSPNAEAILAWDTVLFDKFCRFRHLLISTGAPHGSAAISRLEPLEGKRVLDVGCGFGDTARELARTAASVVGVDASPRFIEASTAEALEAGASNVTFRVADAQLEHLGGPYDLVYSRFGVMFFANPVQALRNFWSALAEGGRLCLVVWRKREDNVWLHTAEKVVKGLVTVPEETDAPTCGPGPFSMSGPDLVSDQLVKAGFHDIAFERHDYDAVFGRDVEDALEFALALGPAGEIIRLAGAEGEKQKPKVLAALRDAFAAYLTPEGVCAASSTWIITATK